MNDERLDRLIDAHLNGEMTEAERRELEERLLHSAADRVRFWELARPRPRSLIRRRTLCGGGGGVRFAHQ